MVSSVNMTNGLFRVMVKLTLPGVHDCGSLRLRELVYIRCANQIGKGQRRGAGAGTRGKDIRV